jgi:hypothetical protein
MRINAYVMAADPWWIEESVGSYYDLVDRIVVTYDADGLSWTGSPLPIDEAVRRLKAIDSQGKCEFVSGRFSRIHEDPLECDTQQRRVSLEAASENADWVIQLDTDEVLLDPARFAEAIETADRRGARGLEYPARYLYTRSSKGVFLEATRSFWRRRASYPGPVAVRAGSSLVHCRQMAGDALYRIDIAPNNTDPAHPADAVVQEVIPPEHAILHFSWVRSTGAMDAKAAGSGHTEMYTRQLRAWRWRSRHPILTTLGPGLGPYRAWYKPLRLPEELQHWRGETDER